MRTRTRHVQTRKKGPLILPISTLNLEHVDEIIFILGSGAVAVIDAASAIARMSKSRNLKHGILITGQPWKDGRPNGTPRALNTYGEVIDYIAITPSKVKGKTTIAAWLKQGTKKVSDLVAAGKYPITSCEKTQTACR